MLIKSTIDFRPTQPFVVAVPIAGNWVQKHVKATNKFAAIELARILVVEEGLLPTSFDVRFTAKAVKVKASVGDRFGQAEDRAYRELKQLTGV